VRLPISVNLTTERLPPELEATESFVVAEALTDTVRHAHATRAEVVAALRDGALHVEVRDDAVGGARMDRGTGLGGLYDRVASMDGELHVTSPSGAGTTVSARIPVPAS
jgi:signal transduction histidine kinase